MFELTVYPHTKGLQVNTIRCVCYNDGGNYASIGVEDSENKSSTGILIRDPVHLRQLAAWATGAAAYLESIKS